MATKQNDLQELNSLIEAFNKKGESFGFPELKVVSPHDCVAQEKNARYFLPERFQLLVDNVKRDGHLESVPLVYENDGKFKIISGHHRVEAAKQAKLQAIIVMVITPSGRDEIVMKQLSHNSLVGQDDQAILHELYKEISTIEARIASGLTDEIEKIAYTSLNFKVGSFRELSLMFVPGDEEQFDATLKELAEYANIRPDVAVKIADMKVFDEFASALSSLKKHENIKNNAVAVMMMASIAKEWVENAKKEETDNIPD